MKTLDGNPMKCYKNIKILLKNMGWLVLLEAFGNCLGEAHLITSVPQSILINNKMEV